MIVDCDDFEQEIDKKVKFSAYCVGGAIVLGAILILVAMIVK